MLRLVEAAATLGRPCVTLKGLLEKALVRLGVVGAEVELAFLLGGFGATVEEEGGIVRVKIGAR